MSQPILASQVGMGRGILETSLGLQRPHATPPWMATDDDKVCCRRFAGLPSLPCIYINPFFTRTPNSFLSIKLFIIKFLLLLGLLCNCTTHGGASRGWYHAGQPPLPPPTPWPTTRLAGKVFCQWTSMWEGNRAGQHTAGKENMGRGGAGGGGRWRDGSAAFNRRQEGGREDDVFDVHRAWENPQGKGP